MSDQNIADSLNTRDTHLGGLKEEGALLHGMRLPGSMVLGLHLNCREEWSGGKTSIPNNEALRTGV